MEYERFTDRSRKVMQLCNQEAQRFNHPYVATEHMLLGLAKEGAGIAANVLKNLGMSYGTIASEVQKLVQAGKDPNTIGKLSLTPKVERVLQYAMEECLALKHNYVGTEHLLLGLLREDGGVAMQVLTNHGLEPERVREGVLNLLGYGSSDSDATK